MVEEEVSWHQDGIDSGWLTADSVGAVRSTTSYGRPGGWWFLPAWLPDNQQHDLGPFRTRAVALREAERLAAHHRRQSRK